MTGRTTAGTTPTSTPTDDQERTRWQAFWVCVGVAALTILDLSKVNVGLPSLEESLGAGSSDLQLIVAGYALAFGLLRSVYPTQETESAGRTGSGDTVGPCRTSQSSLKVSTSGPRITLMGAQQVICSRTERTGLLVTQRGAG